MTTPHRRLRTPTPIIVAATVTARSGITYHLLTSDQIPGLDKQFGRYVHVGCPIHGSDHQPSLSIHVAEGPGRGFGTCFSGTCGARVLVTDLNPEAAANLTMESRGRPRAPRPVTAADLLRRPPPGRPLSEPTPEPWQHKELEQLTRWVPRMRERLADERAQAYLAERGIPPDVAATAGVGYLPPDARLTGTGVPDKWRDRLIFPLGSPSGVGYAGRSLHLWQPGMDENEHKQALESLLESDPYARRRWEKTYPAGWFGYETLATDSGAILVEGPFDRLALLAAGLGVVPVVALVGCAARPDWIPPRVRALVPALDGDAAGQERTRVLERDFTEAGIQVAVPPPMADDLGKDWSERWRRASWEGVAVMFEALDALDALCEQEREQEGA